jgi:hypothetical protein
MAETIYRKAKDTLTAVEMFHGEVLEFTRCDGTLCKLRLNDTGARILTTTLQVPGVCEYGAQTTYAFWAHLTIDGCDHVLERVVGTQGSFYEPWLISGLRIWLDAVDAIFDFLQETHGRCRPGSIHMEGRPSHYHARFAMQDATLRICPELVHIWCPLPEETLRIEDCYRGEDCWLGAYDGASAHAGLDINHPPLTPLYAPIDLDDQFYYNSVAAGHNNNRWRGIRRWQNGAEWILQSAHMTSLLVAEHSPLQRGRHYAEGAGVWSGEAHHSHFEFRIHDFGNTIRLDPWILFWQMYLDQNLPESSW